MSWRIANKAIGCAAAVVLGLVSSGAADITTSYTGGGGAHTNMQPFNTVNYIIALEGTFPSRNAVAGAPEPVDPIGTLSTDPFIGEVSMFGGNFAPRGWALCNGQLLSIDSNHSLFSILGTTYGGDGRSTFALPDMRGRMPIGVGSGAGLSPRYLGERAGDEEVTLNVNQMPSHNHALPNPLSPTEYMGGGQSHYNMQPYFGVNYIVASEGLYPSRTVTVEDPGPSLDSAVEPYLAGVTMFAGNFAPRGWMFADGRTLDIASHTAMFSLMGTMYGGDGRTVFNLPDLQGRTPIGPGNGPGLPSVSIGQKTGVETDVISISEMPSHDHLPPLGTIDIQNNGGNQAHPNMAPSLGLRYVIALEGIFPSRNAVIEGEGPDIESVAGDSFLGEVSLFAGNFAPRGWAFCDGQLLPINQHQALFSILGTTYGGDGRVTFGLPDLRGRTAIHAGQGAGLSNRRLGDRSGLESVVLNLSQLPNHDHPAGPGPAPFGDMDGDWDVDEFDMNTFRGQFGITAPPGMLVSDLDEDGDVDLEDFARLRSAFGLGAPPAPVLAPEFPAVASVVPEPGTICLLAIGALGALVRRGKRRL